MSLLLGEPGQGSGGWGAPLNDRGQFVWAGVKGRSVPPDVVLGFVLIERQCVQDTSAGEDVEQEDLLPVQLVSFDAHLGGWVDEVSQEVVQTTTALGQLVIDAA